MIKSSKISASLFFLISLFIPSHVYSQYPAYFSYDTENNLPSNEVYSILQDKKGFILFGCDAGLFKFDGMRYTSYKCDSQKSRSVTGLCSSSNGKIFCYNFQSQLFFLFNDTLRELKHNLGQIANITLDKKGNLFVNHSKGISSYNQATKTWKNYSGFGNTDEAFGLFTKSATANDKDEIYFLNLSGLGKISGGKLSIEQNNFFSDRPAGNFDMTSRKNELWIFCQNDTVIYLKNGNELKPYRNNKLLSILKNRKINRVKLLDDGKLWICTYKGVIEFDPEKNSVNLFYPQLSFSDCIVDREGNYWFTTLQTGIIRVPDINYKVWNIRNCALESDKLTHVTSGGKYVFFSTVNGFIGRLDTMSKELNMFHTGSSADVQSLDYDVEDDCVYFYINNIFYSLKNKIIKIQTGLPPVKSSQKIKRDWFLASSFGTYLYDTHLKREYKILTHKWSREIAYDASYESVDVATNDGVMRFKRNPNGWHPVDSFLVGKQILSAHLNRGAHCLYSLTFNGLIYQTYKGGETHLLCRIGGAQGNKLKTTSLSSDVLVATNKGLMIFEQESGKWETINKLSGLSTDNILDLVIVQKHAWLATSKGLHQIPLLNRKKNVQALVYIKNLKIAGKNINDARHLNLKSGELISFQPEASCYSSEGNYRYAYRINESAWDFLPANIETISLPNVPSGEFTIELKAIDHNGRDSENSVILKGYVSPPFWQSPWFLLMAAILVISISFLIFRWRIGILKQKQSREIEHLNLENELRLTQQTAIKAQMNPHFIFNVLNSIKSYIYKNDKQKASEYLNNFADLIRMVLDMSSVQYIEIQEELKLLKLYIELEAMMLPADFSYSIEENIDHTHKIPSLIIQPYIENAFKHGLKNKTGDKNLHLNIYSHENEVVVTIVDNGIGRRAAEELKQKNFPGHKSFATSALEKRIAMINKEGKQHVSVEFVDLTDEHNHPEGTKVILKISFND